MFFISRFELERFIRRVRSPDEGVIEIRGWAWDSDIVKPLLDNVYLGVSEVANRYCPVYRDIFLRHVSRVPAPITFKTVRGWVYHAVSSGTLTLVKRYLYNSGVVPGFKMYRDLIRGERKYIDKIFRQLKVSKYIDREEYKGLYRDAKTLFKYLILQAASYNDKILSIEYIPNIDSLVSKVVPSIVERVVDGSPLGLSKQLRIDMFLDNNVILDIKTGDYREFHKYALAGYALAIEADLNRPIDYGVITYLRIEDDLVKVRNDFHYIDDELRREFLEMRDEAMDVIHRGRDPGRPVKCPEYCIYYQVCNPLG